MNVAPLIQASTRKVGDGLLAVGPLDVRASVSWGVASVVAWAEQVGAVVHDAVGQPGLHPQPWGW